MKKTVVCMIGLFLMAVVGTAVAANLKCTVEYINDDVVVMTCEKADKMKVGDNLKVKVAKKEAAIEGC